MGILSQLQDPTPCIYISRNYQIVCAQVRGFWAHLETATNERQQAMFRMLNTHLKHLAQRVETAVGELLEVMGPLHPFLCLLPAPAMLLSLPSQDRCHV